MFKEMTLTYGVYSFFRFYLGCHLRVMLEYWWRK